ncbi:MAG TPA: DUF1549 and DUF1553 domain-containing protein [Caulifigura sp.]|nr:DUF1549 and DUF1553 domain-containing protein [Caulifigura sp.]
MLPRLALCLFLALSAASSTSIAADDAIVLFPEKLELRGPVHPGRIVVQGKSGGEVSGQRVADVAWSTSDAKVAEVQDGVVMPKGNGRAVITASHGGLKATAEVVVADFDKAYGWTFRNDVLPVLAKTGCNMGACHGALAGKGGFRLSLRGYDPVTDHFTMTQQDRGRRVELADPGRSLILAKPTGALAHKGGVRFEVESPEYKILSEWIANGAAGPTDADPIVDHLEILPRQSRQSIGSTQQMLVLAHFTNGEVRDVTPWVKWTSTNDSVARIDDHGRASIMGSGEGAISAWYSQKIAIANLTVPYPAGSFTAGSTVPPKNFIDELVDKQLVRLNLPASPICDDSTFIRRAFLDTIGTLPTMEETKAFLEDTSADKREKLADSLLARKEYVDYWTYKWSDLLTINGTRLRPQAVKAYYNWLRERVEKNVPWDETVRQILTATGNSLENGATNFYALQQSPEDMTENACQAFLGLSIGCAKCHNHPLEKWTNDQYYGMASLFARVKAKGWGGESRNGDGMRTLYVADEGELVQPRTGKPQPPTPLDSESLSFDDEADRRIKLAEWMTSPTNPYFARSITNRVWANYFGVGLVMSVDDMRVSNPASNEELLSATAKYVVDHQFDLKALMRAILVSNAYQRSAEPLPGNMAEQRFYSRYYPKRLSAEVLHDAICAVTDEPTAFTQIAFLGADKEKTDFYPKGTRAIQLYDSAVESYFLQTFGRNQRRVTCECERSDEPTMVQVLHIANGDTVNSKLKDAKNRIGGLLEAKASNAEIVEQAYLVALSRKPTEAERKLLLETLDAAAEAERRETVEDLFWAVLSSREFLFNH